MEKKVSSLLFSHWAFYGVVITIILIITITITIILIILIVISNLHSHHQLN